MDWALVRKQMIAARKRAKLSPAALARSMNVPRSTITRVENLRDRRDNSVNLVTIDAWVRATGTTLADFFLTLERAAVRSDDAELDLLSETAQRSQPEGTVHGGPVLPASQFQEFDNLLSALQQLAADIHTATARAKNYRPSSGDDAATTERGRTSAGPD